jgi:hypothetical protein
MLLWYLQIEKIRFEEICILNEKNLEIARSSINDESIIDTNKSILILDINRENIQPLFEQLV